MMGFRQMGEPHARLTGSGRGFSSDFPRAAGRGERKGFAAWVIQMARRFEREIEAFNRLTARKGELATAVEDVRRAMALSLKAAGREEVFDAMNSAIDEVVAGVRLLEPANVSAWPSGSIERRSTRSRGFGTRAAPVKAGEELSAAT